MKALSLTQPWATLVAIGAKEYETRSWWTGYRGLVAIHASKEFGSAERALCVDEPFFGILQKAGLVEMLVPGLLAVERLPLGAIIAVAQLEDVLQTDLRGRRVSELELAFGDWGYGRYAWRLRNVQRLLEPIPCKGALGLWTVPAEIEARIRQQVGLWERKGDAHG